jgi:hypothetical protein
MFAETGGGSAAYVGLDEVKLFNRALTDVEARNLYLYNIAPNGTVISEYEFNNNTLDTVGTNHATVTTGTIVYEAL